MPTASKLVAGIFMAALTWQFANTIVPYLPPETRIGLFREISALLGLWIGWRFLGKRVGEGFNASLGFGIGAGAFTVFWMMLVFSGNEMIRRAMRMSYDGPVEAVLGMIDIAIEYFPYLTPMDVWGTMLVGSAVIGLVCEAVSRRWP